jgi:hypothetical protein
MNKLEQKLSDLTKALATARYNQNEEMIESIEDEIAEIEYQLEEEYNRRYDDYEDY